MKQPSSSPARTPRAVKTRPLVIRLSDDEIARAQKHAADQSRSRASFLRLMILKGLQEYERELAANH